MYHECKPDIRLTPYVETYWVTDGFVANEETVRIFPDGCVDILFSFEGSHPKNGLQPFQPYLIGTITSYIEVTYSGNVQMFGIRFKPMGVTAFMRIPVNELTNQRLDMSLVKTLFDSRFHEALFEKHTLASKIEHIESYLLGMLSCLFEPAKQIAYAVDLITKNNGMLSITEVAHHTCLCQRQLERRFKSAVGISPKAFSQVSKFRYTLRYLKAHADECLSEVALACGYHDHSHLIKEFERLSGSSPAELRC